MKKLLLLATIASLAAMPAKAVTVTGSYTASIGSSANASLTDNLAVNNFSLTLGAPRSNFVTVDPGSIVGCFPNCYPVTGTLTVVFTNLTANGHNFGGFTETGVYTANYATQTDSVVWNGATVQSGFGLDQDGNVPKVFTKALLGGTFGTLDINLVDGADWNVQTYIEAQLVSSTTPLPAAIWLMGSALGGGALILRRKKARQQHA